MTVSPTCMICRGCVLRLMGGQSMNLAISVVMAVLAISAAIIGWRYWAGSQARAFVAIFISGCFATLGFFVFIERTPDWAATVSMVAALLSGIVLLIVGALLWHDNHQGPPPTVAVNKANLGIALLGSAAIAILIFFLQLVVQQAEQERQDFSTRQGLYTSLAISPDLTGFSAPLDPRDPKKYLDLSRLRFRSKKMTSAYLPNVVMNGADLSYAHLVGANLEGVHLEKDPVSGSVARLQGTYLRVSSLKDAKLSNAILYGADLRRANLTGADLSNADLRHADLRGANLTNAKLDGMKTDADTCMPDEGYNRKNCGTAARTAWEVETYPKTV
jgi:uncharacterized protein YjbI with pentapeptide repeats